MAELGGEGVPGPQGEKGEQGKDSQDTQRQRTFRMSLTIWIIVFSIAVGYQIHENRIQSHKGAIALNVLCSAREDLSKRIVASQEFLKDHPNGILGITSETLRGDISNKIAAYRAQSILNPYCKDGEVVFP